MSVHHRAGAAVVAAALLLSGCGLTPGAAPAATPTPRPLIISSTSTVPTPTPFPSPADSLPTALTPYVPPATTTPAQASTPTTASTPPPGSTASATASPNGNPATSVRIGDFSFTPAVLNVSVGATVTWTNAGPSNHSVTSNDGLFDSGTIQRNGTFSFTFSKAGTFAYHCQIHPTMTGTVVVK